MKFERDGAEIFYEVRGSGRPVVLLHPFPANHHFWDSCAPYLEDRYKLILPDLRAHGDSSAGPGAATMDKHAEDLARVCDEQQVGRAAFVGVSIGGYVMFEFWRRFRERVGALVLANTKAQADSDEAREGRRKAIEDVQQRGPTPFIEASLQRLLGDTTLRNRQDLVEKARALMARMSVQGIVAALQGMMERPDSTTVLKTINVPALAISGEEDKLTPRVEAELIARAIPNCQLEMVPQAGHYAALEQPEFFGHVLRRWLDEVSF